MDDDSKFCPTFKSLLQDSDVTSVKLPPRIPNLNAHLKRFFGSLKSGCLSQTIFFGEQSLHNAVGDFVAHYHQERNHQGLANNIIDPADQVRSADGEINCRELLGGMLSITTAKRLNRIETEFTRRPVVAARADSRIRHRMGQIGHSVGATSAETQARRQRESPIFTEFSRSSEYFFRTG